MSRENFTQNKVREFCQDETFRDYLTYVRETDVFLLYDKTERYHKIIPDDLAMEEIIYNWSLSKLDKNISKNLIKDMVYQLKIICYKKLEELSTGFMAFIDKDLDLDTLEFVEHAPEYYAHHKINFKTQELAKPIPQFLKFLREILVKENANPDEDLIMVIQEMMGYYFMEDLNPTVVFFLVGEGANGKSVLIRLIEEMVGENHVSSYSIQNLTTNKFAPVNLIGKKINLCSEEESKYMKADKFKAMITHDMIECEKKYGAKFVCFKPQTKFLFATNEMPGFDSIGKAIQRRLKIIKFHKEIPEEKQDRNLLAKLKTEIPGIIKWAIEGAKRLKNNNYVFTKTDNMTKAYAEFEEVVSSPVQFLREFYIEDEKGFISTNDLYEHYRDWCTGAGGRQKKSASNFGRDLNKVLKLPGKVSWSADLNKNVRGRQLISKQYANPTSTMDTIFEDGQVNAADLVV